MAHPVSALLILCPTIVFPEPPSLHSRRWKLCTAILTAVFLVSICGYTSKIIEHPHRRANTATRAPSSPELRASSSLTGVLPFTSASSSPELHDQRSTFFRAPCLTEIRRCLSSPEIFCSATRASPSSELNLSSELNFRLPRLLHSMSFPFKSLLTTRPPFSGQTHRPRRCRHHLLRQSWNYFTNFCSHAPMGLPLQTATTGEAPFSWPLPPTPASSHRQRRLAGTYFAGRSDPSIRY